jgi:hypothetical protein
MSDIHAMKLLDASNATGFIRTADGKLRVINNSYEQAIVEGDLTGHEAFHRSGYNPLVVNAAEDVWAYGGLYTYPADLGQQLELYCADNTNDIGYPAIKSGTSDTCTATTLVDADVDFQTATAVAAGDCLLLDGDKEHAIITVVAQHTLTYVMARPGLTPTGAQAYRVVDASTTTGVKVLSLHYLDANYAEGKEFLLTNGNTVVATVATTIRRVQRLHTVFAGTGGAAAGIIDLRYKDPSTHTPVYSRILAGRNGGQRAMYTVPAGKIGYIVAWKPGNVSAAANHYGEHRLLMTTDDGWHHLPGVFVLKDIASIVDGTLSVRYELPLRLPSKTDVRIQCIADASNANLAVTSYFSGWIENA